MPDRPGVANVVELLSVRRQARRGFAGGVAFAALVYLAFVVVPDAGSPALFVPLGFVLAFASGALFTAVLVAVAAYRLTRRTAAEDPESPRPPPEN